MFYSVARILCRVFLLILRRWEIIGLENFPQNGGVIAAANHVSYWDPVVVGCSLNRPVHFMAKAELFKVPVLGPIITAFNAFPVQRGKSDRNAIRKAVEILNAGKVLGVFPEGTRSSSGELLKPHLGAAMLAYKTGVPIMPIAVIGSRGFFGKITVKIGKPIPLPEPKGSRPGRQDLEEYSNQVMAAISQLIEKS